MHITQIIDWKGRKVTLTWIRLANDSDLEQYAPITQCYGICFNQQGEILILDQQGNGTWTLPGGTVEAGETPWQTLEREVMEEAHVTLKDVAVLGVQHVEDPGNEGGKGKDHYQARFVANIDQMLPQTEDPAAGRIHERRFVPGTEVTRYIQWGNTGEAIFADAMNQMGHQK